MKKLFVKKSIRWVLLILLLITGLFYSASVSAQEAMPVVIIQQIRGPESCCVPGDIEMMDTLVGTQEIKNLPLGWAVRYDALTDETMRGKIREFPAHHQIGLLLEVTPSLARASGVVYKGDPAGSDWYHARNAFLIGYSQTERKKIIDTVFQTFRGYYDYYPTFTVSWMIDAWSLEYLEREYGVKVHELTKEQFETDNYTLYGGLFNVPYVPSLNHPLIPQRGGNGTKLLILRQTVSDIEKNYGAYRSFYTSQANDYLSDSKGIGFSYFLSLIDTAKKQTTPNRFALIGLENTNEWKIAKDEYLHQLLYIAEAAAKGELTPQTPFGFYNSEIDTYTGSPAWVLTSPGFPDTGVLWYANGAYRVRLEMVNETLTLTDFRIYGDFTDPYKEGSADYSRAYWIIPYLLDSSQEFLETNEVKKFAGHPVRTDDGVDRFHIILSKEKIESINNTDGVVSLKSRSGSVVLNSEGIRIDETLNSRFSEPIDKSFEEIVNGSDTQSVTFPRHVPFYFETSNGKILLGWETPANIRIPVAVIYKDGPWFLRPEPNFDTVQVRSLASIFQPDRSELPMDKETSVFYFHNREAIATRSPIRLLIDLRNTLSRAVAPKDFTISLEEGEVVTTKPYALDWAIEPFFIDFSSSNFGTLTVTVQNDNVQVAKETINFYPDCIHTVVVCTQNWNMLMGYLWVTARDKKQEAMEKFESWKEDQTVRLTKWWLENSKKWYNKLPFDKLPEFQIHR